MHAFIVCICLFYTLFTVVFAAIPSYIKVCNQKDPELNKCIVNSIEQLREKLKIGIPELNVPPIEPLIIDHIHLLKGLKVSGLNLTNLQIFGISTFQIQDFKFELTQNKITFKLKFQKVDFRGKYQLNTQILLFKLIGEGNVTGSFLGSNNECILMFRKVLKNNQTYINFEKIKFIVGLNKILINFENLFNGDPVLESASNEVLSNSDVLIDEIKPVLEEKLSNIYIKIVNKITERFTYDELFPN